MLDVIIVGAGPAGLSAGIYAKRAGLNIKIFEAKSYGGQIINSSSVENYPALSNVNGFDFATKLYNQVIDLGAPVIYEKVIVIKDLEDHKEVITTKNTYKTKTIILATGADNRKLGLDGEEELIGKGVSYCATCDGNFYKNKIVAINGGGNTAFEDAIYLSNIASKVYLINRSSKFRAEDKLVEEAKSKDNIEFVLNSTITKLNGSDKLNSITINNEKDIEVDGLFIAIGRVPENENFKSIINVDDKGYIVAGENCKTNVPGVFVAGDSRKKDLRQLVTAASDGAIAATEAFKYIKNM